MPSAFALCAPPPRHAATPTPQCEMQGDVTSQRRWEAYDKLGTFAIYVIGTILVIQVGVYVSVFAFVLTHCMCVCVVRSWSSRWVWVCLFVFVLTRSVCVCAWYDPGHPGGCGCLFVFVLSHCKCVCGCDWHNPGHTGGCLCVDRQGNTLEAAGTHLGASGSRQASVYKCVRLYVCL